MAEIEYCDWCGVKMNSGVCNKKECTQAKLTEIKFCDWCGDKFNSKRESTTCSKECEKARILQPIKSESFCNECNFQLQPKVTKTRDIVVTNHNKHFFCSNSCGEVFSIRAKDKILTDLKDTFGDLELDNNVIKILKDKIYTLQFELEDQIYEAEMRGYFKGLDEFMLKRGICPHCKNKNIQSIHHIIPRKFGGQDDPLNLIPLCNKCHDVIEILTDDLFSSGQTNIGELTMFIVNKSFPNKVRIYPK